MTVSAQIRIGEGDHSVEEGSFLLFSDVLVYYYPLGVQTFFLITSLNAPNKIIDTFFL